MMDKRQLAELIDVVLRGLGLWSESARALLLGTAAQESRLGTYLRQLGKGPALGIFQMEPATERDIWTNYLAYHPALAGKITEVTGVSGPGWQLHFNLAYQIAMARVHYLRVPRPLPAADDLGGLAAYWKKYYNTALGKGTVDEFVRHYDMVQGA